MATQSRGSRGEEVRRLQTSLRSLGYLDDEPDGVFGPRTDGAVRAFQRDHRLTVDGKVGDATRGALDDAMATLLRHAERERDGALLDVGEGPGDAVAEPAEPDPTEAAPGADPETVLSTASAEWNRGVHEPPGAGWERIDEYIRGPQGLGWSSEDPYRRNRQFAWCGAFVAFCFGAAGLGAEVRRTRLASTYRLHSWASGTPRLRPLEDARRGDIVIVGPTTGKRWGAHITLCDGVEPASGQVETIEGNAHGRGPDGSRYEGVIHNERPLPRPGLAASTYRVMHVIRPLSEDFG